MRVSVLNKTGDKQVVGGIEAVFVHEKDDPRRLVGCNPSGARTLGCPFRQALQGDAELCSKVDCTQGHMLTPIDFVAWRLTK